MVFIMQNPVHYDFFSLIPSYSFTSSSSTLMPSASLNLIWMGIFPHFIQFCFVTDVRMINYYTYATSVESKLLPCEIW